MRVFFTISIAFFVLMLFAQLAGVQAIEADPISKDSVILKRFGHIL